MHRIKDWLKQAEAMLDEWGFWGWIAATVVAFVLAWPLGLAILGYMIWSGRMSCCKTRRSGRTRPDRTTGNAAFDAYREETLRRLEEEQSAFEGFLERLRRARDKAEFDQFMAERQSGGDLPQQA